MDKEKKELNSHEKIFLTINQQDSEEIREEIVHRKIDKQIKKELKEDTKELKLIVESIKKADKDGDNKSSDIKYNNKNNIEDTKSLKTQELRKLNERIRYGEDLELPKLKERELSPTSLASSILEFSQTIDITDIVKLTKKSTCRISILLGIFVVLVCVLFISLVTEKELTDNEVSIFDISVLRYDKQIDQIDVAITPSRNEKYCAISKEIIDDNDKLDFIDLDENICKVKLTREMYYVYFKTDYGVISEPLEVNNYIVSYNIPDVYYVTPGTSIDLNGSIIAVGNVKVEWNSLDTGASIIDNVYTTDDIKRVNLIATVDGKRVGNTTVHTTNVISKLSSEINTKKEFLTCKKFTYDEALLLDDILYNRVKQAGEGTRAGVVAAARFLTLEFPYRLSYFYENGRLSGTGAAIVDGEGRYYHKGLYLNEVKYNDIIKRAVGPSMWGCNLSPSGNNTITGYNPNGLDCSGFVSWTILNGGFDIGDYGAGQSPGVTDLTDFGEVRSLTPALINSGEIKVGDLFSIYGHIAILVGQDSDNFYIAESLNTFKGLVVNKYNKNNVRNAFPYVVLMDGYYKEDGNLTDLWY